MKKSNNANNTSNTHTRNLSLRHFLFCLLICLFGYSVIVPSSFAQTSLSNVDLTVSPSVIELSANPGDKIQQVFRVRNNLNKSIYYTIGLKKMGANLTTDFPFPQDIDNKDEFSSWLKVDPALFKALPAEWQDITFTITVPKSAAYGYYYAFQIQPSQDTSLNGAGTKVQGQVLIPILLNVKKSDAKIEGKILNFQAKNNMNEYSPIHFTVQFANTGNIHMKPRGNIFTRSSGKNDLAVLDVNAALGTVLPGGKRTFTADWNDGFLTYEPVMENGATKYNKDGTPVTQLTVNWNKLTSFRIGQYTADLIMVYSDGKRDIALDSTTTFWIFPYKIIGGALLIIIIFILTIRFLLKAYVKSQVKRYQNRK